MKISGENVVAPSVQQVWDALLDPAVLVRTIPGCSRLEETAEHTYAMTVTAGVAAIKGTYDGTCSLSDLHEPSSLTMRLQGSGAPGTVEVSFGENGDGSTLLHYDADAVVGGMVGGVGQRMLTSVSKRMAGEFFGNVERAITAPSPATVSPPVSQADAKVFTAPARSAGSLDEHSFLTGIAVGAGLVLVGVFAERIARRP